MRSSVAMQLEMATLMLAMARGPDIFAQASTSVVAIPRIADAQVMVDGVLDEAVWQRAATLRNFSQYLPNDDRPADDSTTVLAWYSSTAIYFGIRAYQDSASVRATLANRDNIGADDFVQVLLDPINDHRQAFVFGVNPFGVQADGMLTDAPRTNISLVSSLVTGAYVYDPNPDFVYESKGGLTHWGYEVEIRIPFKTLRYQDADPQTWSVNVVRMVQATGHQLTWTRVLQTRPSFLSQSGTLTGLTDLRRGLVLDVTPEVTSALQGGPQASGWSYGRPQQRAGVTARWGITPTLSFDGTVRPDFSQIESDAPQITFDPRVALYYDEKRPFFLDGLELFQTPIQLIYTRRLADPLAATKLVGKVGATTVAAIAEVDATGVPVSGEDHPFFSGVRLRRDLGGQSLGAVVTDRIEGSRFNHVAAVDTRLVFGAYDLTFQSAGSVTRGAPDSSSVWGGAWKGTLARSGRHFGLTVVTRGDDGRFLAENGFVARRDWVLLAVTPSVTITGGPAARFENITGNVYLGEVWNEFAHFSSRHAPDDHQADFSFAATLRGGWQVGTGVSVESFGYPAKLFAGDWIERVRRQNGATTADTIPFTGQPRIPNLDFGLNLQTPKFQNFSMSAGGLVGHDENFLEWASARVMIGNLNIQWRPTPQLRTELTYDYQQVIRRTDASLVRLTRVPRLKVEYQLTRSIFVRAVGQYTATRTDSLRDDSRTNRPILFRDAQSGVFTRSAATASNDMRIDWLFSYRPSPGTVFFAGYGSSASEPRPFRFDSVSRTADGFFVKLSYLLRAP